MNRENTGAKPTAPPRLPPEAEQEILEALFEGMEIHSSEIAAIGKSMACAGMWRPSKTATASAWASGSWPVSETRAASVKCWPTEKAAM